MIQDDDEARGYASPACSLHEHEGGGDALATVGEWRRSERARLVARRKAIAAEERRVLDAAIAARLDELLGDVAGRRIAVYWPIRGEPDLRGWFEALAARGAELALPVVEGRDRPLSFRRYRPGEKLVPGALKISVPEAGENVLPDVVLSPVVGFDGARHRLGNGGGYYDRTLAALPRRPLTVGVGYACLELRTVYPQDWDVPMDVIVTESAVRGAEP